MRRAKWTASPVANAFAGTRTFTVNRVGGYVCALLARRASLVHGAALSILAVALYAHEVLTTPAGHGQPTFFIAGTFVANVIGILLGAYLYRRRSRQKASFNPAVVPPMTRLNRSDDTLTRAERHLVCCWLNS